MVCDDGCEEEDIHGTITVVDQNRVLIMMTNNNGPIIIFLALTGGGV